MKFIFRQFLNVSRDLAFAFFRNPRCLPLLHVKEKEIRVLRHSIDVQVGAETWAEVTVLAILPIVLGFRHDLYDPPHRFGESLIHGPFRRFTHIHEFRPAKDGTEIFDHLDVELPNFFGSDYAVRLLIQPKIQMSFEMRHIELRRLVGSGQFHRAAEENLQLLEI
jgi:ligand-binding SRPBCC domain-containing protein